MVKMQKYSIISERDREGKIKHSYFGKVNTNANVEEPIMVSFERVANSFLYKNLHNIHEELIGKIKISKIETKIIEEIK